MENQLLNKAIQKLVVCVNEEKDKLAEEKEKLEEVWTIEHSVDTNSMMLNVTSQMTTQYNLENADSEAEFNSLQSQLALVTATAREQEVIAWNHIFCCLNRLLTEKHQLLELC